MKSLCPQSSRSGLILERKNQKRRRVAEKKRRESKKSDSLIRNKRVLGNIIDVQAARSGVDLTQAEARASGIEVVTAKLNPPKKPKLAEDTSGHLQFEK